MESVLFSHHPDFDKEWSNFSDGHRDAHEGLVRAKRLLHKQFHPTDPQIVLTRKMLCRVPNTGVYDLWKIHVAVKDLRNNQFPRVYLCKVNDDQFVRCYLLSFGSHINNYKDDKVRSIALSRIKDFSLPFSHN